MPKIIKNGKEYSGVPIEVVTAWAPTADPVQVKEPLMGNTDISSIGDGTVTGAIDTINTGLNGVRLVPFTKIVTLPAGTSGNPTTTQASLAEFIPSGWTIKTIIAQLGAYYLPYIVTAGNTYVPLTWIEFVYNNTGVITIKNSATAWTDYELRGVIFLVRA